MKKILIMVLAVICSACTTMKVAEVDPATGYFKASKQASTVVAKAVDLDGMKQILLIPDQDFVRGQIGNIGYFTEIITAQDLEKEIVRNNLQDKVPDVRGRIGLNKAYKEYKPFLWFRYDTRGSGNQQYGRFILTNPETLEDIFVAEVHLDYIWNGVNDQYTWYPLFNEMIRYIEKNSKTYRHQG